LAKPIEALKGTLDRRRFSVAYFAWSCWALLIALIALRQALTMMTPGGTTVNSGAVTEWVGVFLPMAFPTVGAIVASRRPEHPVGWLFFVTALGWGVADAADAYARYVTHTLGAQVILSDGVPSLPLITWLHGWPTYVSTGALVFLILLFPNGRLPSRRWRPVAWFTVGYTCVSILVIAFEPNLIILQGVPSIENPLGIGGQVGQLLVQLSALTFPLSLILFAVAAFSLILRLRSVRGQERQQLKWFTSAWLVVIVVLVANVLLDQFAPPTLSIVWRPFLTIALYLSICLIPVSAGIAILKYRLYEIDILINRALVYSGLTLCVVGVYVLVVGYIGSLFHSTDIISLAAIGIVAVLFQPLRERMQSGINRLFYGQRGEPYAVLSQLGHRLEATFAPDAVLPVIVETVREALKLPYVAIMLRDGETTNMVAESGTLNVEPLRLPLIYKGETIGEFHLSPRGSGEAFDPGERRLMNDLARQAGVAVNAVRLTADLQRSNEHLISAREQLVTTREEERRRLRRDLHDGLGPRLASLTLCLETARDKLVNEPAVAILLDDLANRTREAIADIRRLVYELRPPTLDDLGLVLALREAVAQYSFEGDNGLHITFEAPEQLPILSAAVEVAAYRIIQEALTNIVRHADAKCCTIGLTFDSSTSMLRIQVKDNGRGIEYDGRNGVGLISMRERAEELGGKCSIERLNAGGTCVSALLPCYQPSTNGQGTQSKSY
jgi:signal transduction histidine kinase